MELSTVGGCGLAVLLVATSTVASAHGPPHGRALLIDGEHIVINVDRGLAISTDGGARFHLYCGRAFGVNSTEQAPMRMLSDRRLMLATSAGVQRSSADYCDWALGETPDAGTLVLAGHPTEPKISLVSTSTETSAQGVYRTVDEGASFERIGELSSSAFLVDGMAYAPGDASRVYASARGLNAAGDAAYFMAASTDAGATFQLHEVTLEDDQVNVALLAVHPTDPDVLYARLTGVTQTRDDQLVVSTDGGETFSVLMDVEALRAVAIRADGSRMWVGAASGLWRSDDGGQNFEALGEPQPVTCLLHQDGRLWVCIDAAVGYAGLSRSDDGGETLEHIMTFTDIDEVAPCPAGSAVADDCDMIWDDWAIELLGKDPSAGAGPDASVDSNTDAAVTRVGNSAATDGGDANDDVASKAKSSGCGCRAPGGKTPHGPTAIAALGWLALMWSRRRRRPR